MKTVMIVAGESSGELYGSLLAKSLKKKNPEIQIIGIGGSRMLKEGVKIISTTTDAFGLIEALSAYFKVRKTFKDAIQAIKEFMPNVLVLIDYPDFNLRLAQISKKLKIKILYYVSPQVWAWRTGRVKKIASLVDRMAVILPFEEEIYKTAGVICDFVGHPVLEEIEDILETSLHYSCHLQMSNTKTINHLKSFLGLDLDKRIISFLPGSRPNELKRLLPVILNVIKKLKTDSVINSSNGYQYCIPLAPNTDESKYNHYLDALRQEGVAINKGESIRVLSVSDMAVVTSGTATLQAAFLEIPIVVIYKLSPLTYHLGKRIVDVKHISLVNILSRKEVVKELIQGEANTENIINEMKNILMNEKRREVIINNYRKLKEPFIGKKASDRVADIVLEMTGLIP